MSNSIKQNFMNFNNLGIILIIYFKLIQKLIKLINIFKKKRQTNINGFYSFSIEKTEN